MTIHFHTTVVNVEITFPKNRPTKWSRGDLVYFQRDDHKQKWVVTKAGHSQTEVECGGHRELALTQELEPANEVTQAAVVARALSRM